MIESRYKLLSSAVIALILAASLWIAATPAPAPVKPMPDPQLLETARLNEMARRNREETNEMIDKMKAHGIGMPER